MAHLEPDEIEPGLVIFLDEPALAQHPDVTHTHDQPSFSSRPFVCLVVEGDRSEWSPLTTEHRRERLAILREWRTGGHPQWLRDPQYVSDGADLWRGPSAAFVDASHGELTDRASRARVSKEALAAIADEVSAQRHRRDRD